MTTASLIARILAFPSWLTLAAGIATALASHTAAYHLGATFEFRAGFEAGSAAAFARQSAASHSQTTRQLQDRLDAERTQTTPSARPDGSGRMRCGPSTRDCPR